MARNLLRGIRAGALATLDDAGLPFASLVNVATDYDGTPLLLLSRLAGHTRNLEQRPHCSLLLTQTGKGDPLAHPRLTIMGRAHRISDSHPSELPLVRARFLARHPKSALYADFADFSFWRLKARGFHLNGGFARAIDFGPEAILSRTDDAQALIATEQDAMTHMNQDHADFLRHSVALPQARSSTHLQDLPWRITGIDPDGFDMMAASQTARVSFLQRVTDGAALRAAFAALVRAASENSL